jgi:hypothetical protein
MLPALLLTCPRFALYGPGNITDTGSMIPDQVTDAVINIVISALVIQVIYLISGRHRIMNGIDLIFPAIIEIRQAIYWASAYY